MVLKQPATNNVVYMDEAHTHSQQQSWRNVGTLERLISGAGGGALAIYGLRRRDWLGASLALLGGNLVFRGTSGHSFVYQAMGVNTANTTDTASNAVTSVPHNEGVKVEHVVTIEKAPEELYRFWRNFENLPRFMQHLQSVSVVDSIHSHWVANAPAGKSVEWNAEIINDRPNQLIAWRSVGHSQIGNAGSVHFTPAPGNRGTEVKIVLEYDPPAGRLGSLIAKLFGEEPNQQVREDLRHFKEIMEAGEIPTTKGQPAAR